MFKISLKIALFIAVVVNPFGVKKSMRPFCSKSKWMNMIICFNFLTLKLYKKSVSERSIPQSVFFQENNFASVLIYIKY